MNRRTLSHSHRPAHLLTRVARVLKGGRGQVPLVCGFAALTVALAGCNEHPLDVVEMKGVELQPLDFEFAPRNKVDVLLVIDNSGSMGEEQANLAANFGSFVGALEDAGADYRLAVTTTDVGNSWCPGTTPEFGSFQSSSCRERLPHFISQSGNEDVSDLACLDICGLDDLALAPTYLQGEPEGESKTRPWIQSGGLTSNLPAGVDASQAFRCMGPQGIDGCGFESPLEALRLALLKAQDPASPEYGFLRPDAALSVVIVTDEVDCSVAPGGEGIFDAAGSRTFWSDQTSNFPTSAVCWNAGVRCEGGPEGYVCERANKLEDGGMAADPEDAVLRPVQSYIDLIKELRPADENGRAGVHVALLGGVPSDVGQVGIPYADALDPTFQNDFGVGPGCTGPSNDGTQTAVPPVRLRDFAEAFAQDQLFSVCEDDYSDSLRAVVEAIKPALRGVCIPGCLSDEDATLAGTQAECVFTELSPDFGSRAVPACELVGEEVRVPDGEAVCAWLRGDSDGSATPIALDDASEYCEPQGGAAVAIEIFRPDGEAVPTDSRITGSCSLASAADGVCG